MMTPLSPIKFESLFIGAKLRNMKTGAIFSVCDIEWLPRQFMMRGEDERPTMWLPENSLCLYQLLYLEPSLVLLNIINRMVNENQFNETHTSTDGHIKFYLLRGAITCDGAFPDVKPEETATLKDEEKQLLATLHGVIVCRGSDASGVVGANKSHINFVHPQFGHRPSHLDDFWPGNQPPEES